MISDTPDRYGLGDRARRQNPMADDLDAEVAARIRFVSERLDLAHGDGVPETEAQAALLASLEAELRAGAEVVTSPAARECLVCFVYRMLSEFHCWGLIWALHYRDVRAPRATALESRLMQVGAGCDCEIFLNGYQFAPRYLHRDERGDTVPVDPPPGCLGVGRGSTRPCGLWHRQWR